MTLGSHSYKCRSADICVRREGYKCTAYGYGRGRRREHGENQVYSGSLCLMFLAVETRTRINEKPEDALRTPVITSHHANGEPRHRASSNMERVWDMISKPTEFRDRQPTDCFDFSFTTGVRICGGLGWSSADIRSHRNRGGRTGISICSHNENSYTLLKPCRFQ